jgi:hypothetical protein
MMDRHFDLVAMQLAAKYNMATPRVGPNRSGGLPPLKIFTRLFIFCAPCRA